jgi:uncharacterized protein (TIGR03067 family)
MTEPILVHDHQGRDFSPNPNEEIFYKVIGENTDGLFDYFDMRVGHLEGFPLHIHIKQHETFHVFEGSLLLQVDKDYYLAKAGDFVMVPKNTVHTFTNIQRQPARTTGVISPGGFDKFVGEMIAMTKASGGVQDPKKVDEICARHDQKFVGPPLAALLGLVPEPAKGAAVKADLEQLEGEWTLVAHAGHGSKWLAEHGGKFVGGLRLDGNLLQFWVEGGKFIEGIGRIDPTKSPKTIDIVHLNKEDKGRTGLGIYELNRDTLRVCWAVAGLLDVRPIQFPASAAGEELSFNTYERVRR